MNKIKFKETLTRRLWDYKLSNGGYAVCDTAMSEIYRHLPNKVEVEVANYYFPHSKRIIFKIEQLDEYVYYRYFNDKLGAFRNLYTAAGDCICSHLRISDSGKYNIWVKFKKL
jgi:hypothetical protein